MLVVMDPIEMKFAKKINMIAIILGFALLTEVLFKPVGRIAAALTGGDHDFMRSASQLTIMALFVVVFALTLVEFISVIRAIIRRRNGPRDSR